MVARSSCPDAARWADLLDGRLADDERLRLAAHLDADLPIQDAADLLAPRGSV